MGDSDDEVDKRNVREKFKHERNDYDRHDSRKNHDVTDRYMLTPRIAIVCVTSHNHNHNARLLASVMNNINHQF